MITTYNLEYRLTDRQKIELQTILNRKAASVCRKSSIYLRLTGQRKPDGEGFAEFWCRTSGARQIEHRGKPYIAVVGLLQFTLYPEEDTTEDAVEGTAHGIVDGFSGKHWIVDEAFVETHQMAAVWLPPSVTRPRIMVVDGSFTYNVLLGSVLI